MGDRQVDPETAKQLRQKKELLITRLALVGLQRQDTAADGNCQYIALVRALGWPDDAQSSLRQEVAAFLAQNGEEFDGFHCDGDWSTYLAGVRGSAWGDHLTLAAVARMFKCVIEIVSDADSEEYTKVVVPPKITSPTITIAHYGEKHYESCVALEDSGV